MQIYQLVDLIKLSEPNMLLVTMINIYSMTFECSVIFLLAYFWKDT